MPTAIILDDLQVRHDEFKEKFGAQYQTIYHVYNFAQFFDLITKIPCQVDYVSLDHDLGDFREVALGTGMMAVKALGMLPANMRPKAVNVHSHNWACAPIMQATLRTLGYPDATYELFSEQ